VTLGKYIFLGQSGVTESHVDCSGDSGAVGLKRSIIDSVLKIVISGNGGGISISSVIGFGISNLLFCQRNIEIESFRCNISSFPNYLAVVDE